MIGRMYKGFSIHEVQQGEQIVGYIAHARIGEKIEAPTLPEIKKQITKFRDQQMKGFLSP